MPHLRSKEGLKQRRERALARGYIAQEGRQGQRRSRSRSRGRGRDRDGGGGDPGPRAGPGPEAGPPRRADPEPERGSRGRYVGVVTDLQIPACFRGRILGDLGSNIRKIVDVLRADLGHVESEHGPPPFVHINNDKVGVLEFEIELYHPFDTAERFRQIEPVFRAMVLRLRDEPVQTRRPARVQPDDWECPNEKCGNLCFARRTVCPMCGALKPGEGPCPPEEFDEDALEHVCLAGPSGAPQEDECQVVWLVPEEKRGYAIGKQGAAMGQIKEESGAEVWLTCPPSTRNVDGGEFCLAFVRGPPEKAKAAIGLIAGRCGGRLARDGFEDLLAAAALALQGADQQTLALADIARDASVRAFIGSAATRLMMRGAGMRSLLDCFKAWPDEFAVVCNDRGAAEIQLATAAPCRGPGPTRPPWQTRRRGASSEEESQGAGEGADDAVTDDEFVEEDVAGVEDEAEYAEAGVFNAFGPHRRGRAY